MILKSIVTAAAMIALTIVGARASTLDEYQIKYLTIKSVEVREISHDVLNQEKIDTLYRKNIYIAGLDQEVPLPIDPIDRAAKVITVARDLVALGEDVYKLVIKGKPTNSTTYTPISVIPRVNGQPVDILDTENWKMPTKRTFQVVYTNLYNIDTVKFRYSVIYAAGGSYNGKGAYLTSAQIVPESVSTLFGYDFTATMKLGGIVNRGTKANPIAGATLLMEHTVGTVVKAQNEVDTFFISGNGEFKKF